jgi:hypothetical protein
MLHISHLLSDANASYPANELLKLWNACSIDERVEFCRLADPEKIFEVIEIAIGMSDGNGGVS